MKQWIPYALLAIVVVSAALIIVEHTTTDRVVYLATERGEQVTVTTMSQRFERALIDNQVMPTSSWHENFPTDQATMH